MTNDGGALKNAGFAGMSWGMSWGVALNTAQRANKFRAGRRGRQGF